MNIALAGFSQGQQWHYNKAPAVVKMWLEKKCILFETKICSLVTENGESFKKIKTLAEINQIKMDKIQSSQKPEQKKPKLIKPNRKKLGRLKGSGKVKMKKQHK